MEEVISGRVHYSISEVCKLAKVKPHVLRYWESEFKLLNPPKNQVGNRIYRIEDVKLILTIKHLLYDERYTIEGAKKKLSDMVQNTSIADDQMLAHLGAKQLLLSIKEDLLELLTLVSE